jgi:hypothetical protein
VLGFHPTLSTMSKNGSLLTVNPYTQASSVLKIRLFAVALEKFYL